MKFWSLIFILIFSSCESGDAVNDTPSYVIREDTMATLVSEHYLLNAISQDREVRKKRLTDFVKLDQKALYDSLGVSKSRFDTSMLFYLKDYPKMIKIHENAMEMLSTRMAELKAAGADSNQTTPKISAGKLKSK